MDPTMAGTIFRVIYYCVLANRDGNKIIIMRTIVPRHGQHDRLRQRNFFLYVFFYPATGSIIGDSSVDVSEFRFFKFIFTPPRAA